MKLSAKTIVQNDTVLYSTALSVEDLTDPELFQVDLWNPEGEGYQRELSPEHINRIARYIKDAAPTNVLPTSIIINARSPFSVTKTGNGTVDLNITSFPLYIVDGQHRVAALRRALEQGAELDHYEVPVTLTQFSLVQEILHFRNVNATANRVPKSLRNVLTGTLSRDYGIMPANAEELSAARASQIVQRLALDANGPWHGKVALGGFRRRFQHVTTQASLADSLEQMFRSGRFSDPEEPEDSIYTIIKDFWQALADTYPTAFASPQHYTIQRASSFYALHNVLMRIMANYTLNPTYDQFMAAFAAWEAIDITDNFWHKTNNLRGRLVAGTSPRSSRYLELADLLFSTLTKDAFKASQVQARV